MNGSQNEQEEEKESSTGDNVADPFHMDMDEDNEEDQEDNRKADIIVDNWMRVCRKVDWRHYGKSGTSIDSKKPTLFEKICSCDILRWFRETGGAQFPSIAVLARVELAKMDNSGYQERVFSSASGAMANNQAKMAFDVLEKRTLLYHNRTLMEQLK